MSVPRRIVDGDRVRAAERVDRDLLDVVQVHGDVALDPGEQRMVAISRQSELLRDPEAIEQHLVEAASALDLVAAVALVPTEDVIARSENPDVGALVAIEEIVAASSDQRVVARAAENGVIACAAGERVVARAAEEGSLPSWPESSSLPLPPVSVSLPSPPTAALPGAGHSFRLA